MTNLLSNGIRFTSNSCELLSIGALHGGIGLTAAIRKIELKFDLSFEPPADATCLMPRLPERPSVLKDDVPVFLYVAGELRKRHAGEAVLRVVTDTGPGLTPKELELLFQRFSQVSRESLELNIALRAHG